MTILYSIAIDLNDNGDFTDLGDAITADILSAEWHLGLAQPYSTVSEIAQAMVIVRNQIQAYSPEISNNLMSKLLRIQSDDGTTIRTHFIGSIQQVNPTTGNQGRRTTQIIAQGREHELSQHNVRLPLQTQITADQALTDIFDQIRFRYDVLDGMCIIGRDSIGSSDIFPDETFTRTFDTGVSVFAFLGDDWADGLPADVAISQIMAGEGGRFIFNRNGDAQFYNRHHWLTDDVPSATFDDDMSDVIYAYGDVINAVEVEMTPRAVGDSNTKIWSLSSPLCLERNSAQQIIVRYELDDEPVGALALEKILPNGHFKAYANANNTSIDLTSEFKVVVVEAGLSASVLEIRNTANSTGYLTQLDLYGTPLITGDKLSIKQDDAYSMAFYGRHYRKIRMPVITDLEEAQGIAQWELQRRKQPRGRLRELHTHTRNHPTDTLALTLFDLITVAESQTGHAETYHIIAEHHIVDMGATRHRVRWLLEPAESDLFFIIGKHSIGDDVVLVPR